MRTLTVRWHAWRKCCDSSIIAQSYQSSGLGAEAVLNTTKISPDFHMQLNCSLLFRAWDIEVTLKVRVPREYYELTHENSHSNTHCQWATTMDLAPGDRAWLSQGSIDKINHQNSHYILSSYSGWHQKISVRMIYLIAEGILLLCNFLVVVVM